MKLLLAAPLRTQRADQIVPMAGSLSPRQWKGAIEAAGFADTRFVPDVMRIHRAVSDFFVAAIGAIRPD